MPKLIYLTITRFPTEKAHGLQIAQNCEAFANSGYDVQLWVPRRFNTRQMQAIDDPFAHYGVEPNFKIARIPCLDLFPLTFGKLWLQKITFVLQVVTYILFAFLHLPFAPADIYYSRDEYVLLALSFLLPKKKLAFEIHQFWSGRVSGWVQRLVVRRVSSVIAITPKLGEDIMQQHGARAINVLVAHDGIRAARFAHIPTQSEARREIGWPVDAFIVGFVGRLHMLNMDKGVGMLVDALAQVENVSLALVGGPDEIVAGLRERWLVLGLPEARFLYAGQVKPQAVPLYLAAFDVCAMPHPFTPQFAYYTSPLKLFEYMAAGRAIVASDLPGWADVVQHEKSALLVPPDDVAALAQAIQRLRDDGTLRDTLGHNARDRVLELYTWAARAGHIRAHLERDTIQAAKHPKSG